MKRKPSSRGQAGTSRTERVRVSAAATKADAAERMRILRMSAVERALLALDLGERCRAFAGVTHERL